MDKKITIGEFIDSIIKSGISPNDPLKSISIFQNGFPGEGKVEYGYTVDCDSRSLQIPMFKEAA